jgi:enoyl-CoA hydratase/carnithine racemase
MADIEVERRDAIAILWFNRPQVLNAFRSATFDACRDTLLELQDDSSVAAVVLTGRGRGFCAGEDLAELDEEGGLFTVADAYRSLHRLQGLTERLARFGKPTIAALNGPAVGLGAELTLACQVRIAQPEAYLLYPEARRGMVQTNGCFYFLPRMIGLGRAAEWLLTGRRVPAEEAHAAGVIAEIVPGVALVDRAVAIAQSIAWEDQSAA